MNRFQTFIFTLKNQRKVWMCGGSLEILPCSRVGHLYRESTYSFDGDRGKIITRNNNRLIEVWMDEFRNLIYAAYPSKIFLF